MDKQAANPSEAAVAIAAAFSLGGAGVFFPSEWSKTPQKGREPADVIWANRDCAVLIFHQRCKSHDDEGVSRERAQKSEDHNFGQARGALKVWRTGALIKGSSAQGPWELAIEGRQVVVLSVVESPHARLKVRRDLQKELGVVLAATIPHDMVLCMSECGLPAIDLLTLLGRLSGGEQSLDPQQCCDAVREYAKRAWELVIGTSGVSHCSEEVFQTVRAVASLRGAPVPGKALDGNGGELLVDVPLTSIYELVFALSSMRETVTPKRPWFGLVPLGEHMVLLCVGHMGGNFVGSGNQKLVLAWGAAESSARPARAIIMWEQTTGAMSFAARPAAGKSALWRILDSFGDKGVWPSQTPSEGLEPTEDIYKTFGELAESCLSGEEKPTWHEVDPAGTIRKRFTGAGSMGVHWYGSKG